MFLGHCGLVRHCVWPSRGAHAPPGVGGSIRRFTFFAPRAVRGGPPLTLFTKHDFLDLRPHVTRNGWCEHTALTKNDVSTWPCVVLGDIFSISPTRVAFRPQNRPNSRYGLILGVISPVWSPGRAKSVQYYTRGVVGDRFGFVGHHTPTATASMPRRFAYNLSQRATMLPRPPGAGPPPSYGSQIRFKNPYLMSIPMC